jgi:DNA-binding Lrp family transcriptional regulator
MYQQTTALAMMEDLIVPTAFVLLNTEVGSELDVLRELRKVDGVEEAVALYGAYDIMLRVACKSMQELKRIVTWDVRKKNRIKTTITMIISESTVAPINRPILSTLP